MKCPNCGREESWEDASFCSRCGKQLISIITNEVEIDDLRENKKIHLQIYQISIWVFMTIAAFLYVSGLTPKEPTSWAVVVLIVSAIPAVFVKWLLTKDLLPKKSE